MPRFFFDVIDQGVVQVDHEGLEFPDLYSAVEDGKRALAEMVGEAMPGKAVASVRLQVRDGPDTPVVTLTARVEAAPDVDYHRRRGDKRGPA